ncbi:MAG: hypothetical protein IPG93_10265 [Burkholderiales bacterium]|nr:hypothetical protein [Burkholderiales bacterium]
MVFLYTYAANMSAEKTVSMSFRVTPRFKLLLQEAAARDNRSLTNMLEALLMSHCSAHGIGQPADTAPKKFRGLKK